jgi:hypothetical protein
MGARPQPNANPPGVRVTSGPVRSTPGYIAPPGPPSIHYVAPPKDAYAFPFDESKRDIYANLYSILRTIDAIEEKCSEGLMDYERSEPLKTELKKQFLLATGAARFNEQHVRAFVEAADLYCGFALNFLFPKQTADTISQRTPVIGMEIGAVCTSFSDLLMHVDVTVAQVQEKLVTLRSALYSAGFKGYNCFSVVGSWVTYLEKKRTSDVLNDSERKRMKEALAVVRTEISKH